MTEKNQTPFLLEVLPPSFKCDIHTISEMEKEKAVLEIRAGVCVIISSHSKFYININDAEFSLE